MPRTTQQRTHNRFEGDSIPQLRQAFDDWAVSTEFTRTTSTPVDAGDQQALRDAHDLLEAALAHRHHGREVSMGTKRNDRCLDRAADNEPIFVLRAQDKLAPALVRQWAMQYATVHTIQPPLSRDEAVAHELRFNEAMALADRMEAWPVRKFPD